MQFSARGGRFFYTSRGSFVTPPPEDILLVTDDATFIITDDGSFIKVV